MAAGTVIGSPLAEADFGLTASEQGLVTQSIAITRTADEVEIMDHNGNAANVGFHNERSEGTIEGYGTTDLVVGAAITLANAADFLAGFFPGGTSSLVVDEVTASRENTNFVKATVKFSNYKKITAL